MRNAAFMFSSRRGTKRLSNTWVGDSCLNRRWSDAAKGVLKDDLKRLSALEKEVLFPLGEAFGECFQLISFGKRKVVIHALHP